MDQHMNAMAPSAEHRQTSAQEGSMKRFIPSLISWLITLVVPVALIGLAVRLVLVPVFLQLEYRMPYFPPDDYGFATQQRIHWATYAWNYLVN